MYTSWLKVAETELSELARQCLDRRIPDRDTLAREVAAWERKRNAAVTGVRWQFTTADARIKLSKLYPARTKRSRARSRCFPSCSTGR